MAKAMNPLMAWRGSPAVTGRGAAGADDLNVSVVEAIAAPTFLKGAGQGVAIERQGQVELGDVGEQPIKVTVEAEKAAPPHVNHVIGGVGMQEAEIEDRDAGLLNGAIVAVDEGNSGREAALGLGFFLLPHVSVLSRSGHRSRR